VRAALAIQRSLIELNRKNEGTGKPTLVARIAIDTGPVVIDATGEVFGDVPNIAAREQGLAESGTVVVTARVQRQVAGLFVAEKRGDHELKGVPEPVTLFRIFRASGGGRRAGQRHLTPLVGRDDEIAMLMRRWERARQGDGQLVLIVGEPGLGKSRLIEEFHSRLRETPHTWVEWSCSQLLQNTPLHPVTEWGRQRFGGGDLPAQRLADLESSLAQVKLDPTENVALLAPLLDIPLSQERVPTLPPEELRRRQLAALSNWIVAGARVQPVVLAVEDVHWADPTTLELLRGVAERGALSHVFVLITARPEFRPPWSTRSHHSAISLSLPDRQQVRHMVGDLAASQALPEEVVKNVTDRSGGVPLFKRALDQIRGLPITSALRREEINLQIALANALMHVKGYAASETKAAGEKARLLIEQAEAVGETPEDPLLLLSVLNSFWSANAVAFNGDTMLELAAQVLTLAEKQRATTPFMIGHRLMGTSLFWMGEAARGRANLDRAIALYDVAEHRPLGARFGTDVRVAALSLRSMVLQVLGYPEAAVADSDQALKDAREIGQAASLLFALSFAPIISIFCGNYARASAELDEAIALADDRGTQLLKAIGVSTRGVALALTDKASEAVRVLISGFCAMRSTGSTFLRSLYLAHLASAYAHLDNYEDAWRCIDEAMIGVETNKERWFEAEVYRTAGEIARTSPEPDATKAVTYFERALAVAHQQQAKAWELRAAMSMARLWRDQGKRDEARELLAPVYGWFTEGFDTLDLKEAKALLEALAV
jgi:predicted ATPase